MIPLSAINQYLFCPRRAALIHVEGIFVDNQHTLRGDIVHEHSDLAGFEIVKGVTLLRALPVWSDRLGLNGKCDIVERHPDGELRPIEFKLGKRRQWSNDDAQLCAQAICLQEMFRRPVTRGAVFHADSKRRREVEFTPELRALVEQTVAALHALLAPGLPRHAGVCEGGSTPDSEVAPRLPPAIFKPACEECSLYQTCLPEMTSRPASLERAARQLFQT